MNQTCKNGYLVEQIFTVSAMKNGLVVSKPITGMEVYDYIVEGAFGFVAIQVKKSFFDKKRRIVCEIRSRHTNKKGDRKRYVTGYDYLAVYCEKRNGFYIIPREIIAHRKTTIVISNTGPYKAYFENWNI